MVWLGRRLPPHQRLLPGDVERMTRVAVLGGAESPEFAAREKLRDRLGPGLVFTDCAPRGDNLRTTRSAETERGIIVRPHGIFRRHHFFGIRCAQRKDIGHPETIKALAFGKRSNARERGIQLGLIGGARVQPNPHDEALAEKRIPTMNQAVAVSAVGGEMAFIIHDRSVQQGTMKRNTGHAYIEGFSSIPYDGMPGDLNR